MIEFDSVAPSKRHPLEARGANSVFDVTLEEDALCSSNAASLRTVIADLLHMRKAISGVHASGRGGFGKKWACHRY